MKNRKNRPVNGKVFRSGVYSTAILAAAHPAGGAGQSGGAGTSVQIH